MLGVAVVCESPAIVRTDALQRFQPLIDSGKTADLNEMPLVVVVQIGPNNHVLRAYIGSRCTAGRSNFCGNATYRENALRQSGCSQITLGFLVIILCTCVFVIGS